MRDQRIGMRPNVRTTALMCSFPFFLYACLTNVVKTEPTQSLSPQKLYNADVLAVRMSSGEEYRFREARPAKVVGDRIDGQALAREEIPLDQIKKLIKDPLGHVLAIIDSSGASHELAFGRIEKETLIAYFDEPPGQDVSLLYSQVSSITFKSLKFSLVRTLALVLGVYLVAAALAAVGFAYLLNAMFHTGGR